MTTALRDECSPLQMYSELNPPVAIMAAVPAADMQPAETDNKPRQKSPSSHILASQLASAVSTTMFYPMDTLRIRYMSQDGTIQRQHNGQTYRSIYRAVGVIWKEEGLRALFRGCHVAVLGAVVAWGVYMFVYRKLCEVYNVSSFASRTGMSVVASVTSALLTTPIWLLKTRMQIECRAMGTCGSYSGFFKGFHHMLVTTGVRSLWRGASAQLLLVLPNSLGFPIYDSLKDCINQNIIGISAESCSWVHGRDLTVIEACLCSVVAKVFVVTLSQPFTMLKVRLQDQRWNQGEVRYMTIKQSIPLIIRREGVYGFTRGLASSLLYSVPRGVAYYVLYEKSLQFFSRRV
ncbi:mitochondrial carrier protein, putative [Trypanosoma brucei brucei TREU927]|uniref:Mitochondrial carrier protein, putative n=1 Tax=Trypanosoma brucei brucei (strain 927/4 GUTat10.1) TaxID=185431 RepID=Q382A2_TRYB2|nr:mitochondrial carrier protein, putative [Trypanosoma brucei brucei TREU927]EAN80379.1 mitochondrial carrier protein, putative [Trypanosoma brucei brucei TREU927]